MLQNYLDKALTFVSDDQNELDSLLEELKKDLKLWPGRWYTIRSYSSKEKSTKLNIENRVSSANKEDSVYEVVLPIEQYYDYDNKGKRKLKERLRIPGYILVRMDFDEEVWATVRYTPGVTGFIGSGKDPIPMRNAEVMGIIEPVIRQNVSMAINQSNELNKSGKKIKAPTVEFNFEVGDSVRIVNGPFESMDATIGEIDRDKQEVKVNVFIFGRDQIVPLRFEEIATLD